MNWLARLFRRARLESDLDKELLFHLHQHEQSLLARGLSPAEARRLARLALGGPEQVKEQCRDARGARWLEDLLQDALFALRSFRRQPAFTLAALLLLALGIGATTVMFAVVNSVLLRPLPYPNPSRLVTLRGFDKSFGEFWGFSDPDFQDLARSLRTVSLAAWTFSSGAITSPGEPAHIEGRQVSSTLFPVFGLAPALGRAFRPSDDRPAAPPVAILSDSLWRSRFSASPSALGQSIAFDGKTYTVVGVLPPGFPLARDADLFIPLHQSTDPRMQNRFARFLHVAGRLNPGADPARAQSELTLIARRLEASYPKSNAGLAMRFRPFLAGVVGDIGGTLWLLLAAIALVLLIACVNIAGLFLTRASARSREFALRAALGARRSRLIRQSITESAVLGLAAGILGLAAASLALRPFVALWPGDLPRAAEIHIDPRAAAFSLAVSLLAALLFGLAPALRLPLLRLEDSLKSGGRALAGPSARLHSPLVASEIALALVLLVSAGALGRALLNLSSLNPGFRPANVLAARVSLSPSILSDPSRIAPAWQALLDRVRSLPEVRSAALADIVPMREGENVLSYRATPNPLPPNRESHALASSVTPDYLSVMGIPLLAGRFFSDHDNLNSRMVVVVDENLARHAFGTTNVTGRLLWVDGFGAAPVEIVGVTGHVLHWGLAGDGLSRVQDQLYYPFAQVPPRLLHFFSSVMSVAVRTRPAPLAALPALERALRADSSDQTLYEVRSMDSLVHASLARERFLSVLFSLFAALALLLACTGIYGVIAYLTARRTPEFGVRIALGARPWAILRLVLAQSLKMILPGLALGLAASLAAQRALLHLVPAARSTAPLSLALMIPLLAAAALSATLLPARRATRIDPVKALRHD